MMSEREKGKIRNEWYWEKTGEENGQETTVEEVQ